MWLMAPDLNLSWERGEEEEGKREEEPASIEKSSCIPEAPFALVAFQNDDDGRRIRGGGDSRVSLQIGS